jgi:hypothetical protein
MLGYVGLATRALAAAAMWRLYRRRPAGPGGTISPEEADRRRLVRVWTWLLIGAGLWALGYYLPSYRLIHAIPILGRVRCPARMLLVVDMALAVLAAVAVDRLAAGDDAALRKSARRTAVVWIPLAIVASIGLLGVLWMIEGRFWSLAAVLTRPPGKTAMQALIESLYPDRPAVYVPVVLAVVTAAAVWGATARGGRRTWLLVALLLADLFLLARFVDVPSDWSGGRPVEASPAAAWLREHHPAGASAEDDGGRPYRVWGLSRNYHHRPAELLLPATCTALGFDSVSYYGPLQPAEHAHLLGFRCWGENYEWAWLLRRNHLLSLFNVRFILAAEQEHRDVIESVRIPDDPPGRPGENLLAGRWERRHAVAEGGTIRLCRPTWPPWRLEFARATMPAAPTGGRIYRLSLDARAPDGAGAPLTFEDMAGPAALDAWWQSKARLRVDHERLGPDWRHFEWTLQAPLSKGGDGIVAVRTLSDTPIEVRRLALRPAERETPLDLTGRLAPGDRVYVDRTPEGLPPLRAGDPRVHVYENRLCLDRRWPVGRVRALADRNEVVETLRWRPEEAGLPRTVLVAGRPPEGPPSELTWWAGRGGSGDAGRPANAMGALRRGAPARSTGPPLWWLPLAGLAGWLGMLIRRREA